MKTELRTSIIKVVKKENPYTQILNRTIEDDSISYKARGILCKILSKPSDWEVYISDLQTEHDREKSVRSGIKELIDARYMQRYRVFDKETGRVHHWETLTSEIPFSEDELIRCVKEEYLKDQNGKIIYKTIQFKNFKRSVPIVINREVILLHHFVDVAEPNLENEGQLINYNTNNKINTNNSIYQSSNIEKKEDRKKEVKTERKTEKEKEIKKSISKEKKEEENLIPKKEVIDNLINKLEEEIVGDYMRSDYIRMLKAGKFNTDLIIEAYKKANNYSLSSSGQIQDYVSYLVATIKNLYKEVGEYYELE